MRFYYAQAAAIHRFSEGLIARVTEDPAAGRFMRRTGGRQIRPGVLIQGHLLAIAEKEFFTRAPINLITIFADCQAHERGAFGQRLPAGARQPGADRRHFSMRPAHRDGADGNSVGAPARGRDAGGDASRGRAGRGDSRVRQSLRARAARPLPHLYGRPAFAGRGARARAAARGRVQGQQSAADRGRARGQPRCRSFFSPWSCTISARATATTITNAARCSRPRSRAAWGWTARRPTWWCSWCATI